MTTGASIHTPVMAAEVAAWLRPLPGQIFVDGTLGGGGHAALLGRAVAPSGRVLGLDVDATALERASTHLGGLPVETYHASYAKLPLLLESLQLTAVDGIVLDLGLSSDQLADASRGFSFHSDGPLDLRFDVSRGLPASELLARWDEKRLADALFQFGEERYSRRIARRIVAERANEPLRTASQLARLVRSCVPRGRGQAMDPATRTFQALRIAVNNELQTLQTALETLPPVLSPGGRMAILSFHSLEDRLVKNAFRNNPHLLPLNKKPFLPGDEEAALNPRARSAKLRVAEKLDRSSPQPEVEN